VFLTGVRQYMHALVLEREGERTGVSRYDARVVRLGVGLLNVSFKKRWRERVSSAVRVTAIANQPRTVYSTMW
jgi:hypothetical protein